MGKALCNEAANRKAEYIDDGEAKRFHEDRDVIGHAVDRRRVLAGRTGNARIVEQDHRPARGETIGDQRVPIVHPTAEMLKEYERRAALGAEAAIGVADAIRFDELSGGGEVAIARHCKNPSFNGLAATR